MNKQVKHNAKTVKGGLQSERLKIGIVVSRFNEKVTQKLLEGALRALREKGLRDSQIEVAWVPGAFEIPLIAKRLAETGRFDGIIALGAVIRGETPHFEFISTAASQGLLQVALATDIPVAFGILTTDTVRQAVVRASLNRFNRGGETALTILETVNLLRKIH